MAVLKVVNVKIGKNASLKGVINYVLQPKKTEEKLATGICCDVPVALETFLDTKRGFGKIDGRQYYHFVQSFPPNENITTQQAHELAIKFIESCKKLRGFEILVVTHKDRKHIHTHFIVNSVSFIDGHKFHITKNELADMKEMQNQLCIKNGYSAAPKKGFDMFGNKRTEVTANNAKTYRTLKNAKEKKMDSYIVNCSEALLQTLKMSQNKDQFIQLMKAQGFTTEWKENKKHITFTDLKRKAKGDAKCKVRLYKLAQYFPELKDLKTKEDLENEFKRNNQSNNRRLASTTIDNNKSAAGERTEIIDLNSGYERYSAKVDSARTERATQNAERFNNETDTRGKGRTVEEQVASSKAVGRVKTGKRTENIRVTEQNTNTRSSNEGKESGGYSR